MVGVPGRSKGCSTCRSRKKGCGKQRPTCIQCLQAGLTCGGYERERVWVNTPQESWAGTGSVAYSTDMSSYHASDSDAHSVTSGTVTLHDSLLQTARQDLYIGQYYETYHPATYGHTSSGTSSFSTMGWAGVSSRLYEKEPALKYALAALSASTLSIKGDDPGLRVKGIQAYSSGIKELSIAFKQPHRIAYDGLLGAIRLMGFYEILFGARADTAEQTGWSAQMNGWHGHICGEQSILLFRGPASFMSGSAHRLFVDGRQQIIMLAVSKRRRTILAETAWKTIPWQQNTKSPKDLLLDILAAVPGHLEDLDTLRACIDVQRAKELRYKLLADCEKAHFELQAWNEEYGAVLAKFDYTMIDGPLPIPETAEDLELLRLCHLYWMTCTLVYSTNHFSLELNIDEEVDDFTSIGLFKSPRDQAHSRDIKLYSYKIARAIHLFTKPQYRLASFHAAMVPLGVALRILVQIEPRDEPSEERTMLINYLQHPFMGHYAGKFMGNIQLFLQHHDLRRKASV
ncbi:Zn(2)-C6 fungal-type DNA-binding domain protein [Paramyrothecium foliicola]|nr:Zn(2)-C6 fungal-type DNA-binding domain protein [Paramyrothecium foliicola]